MQTLARLDNHTSLSYGKEQTKWTLPVGEQSCDDKEEVTDLGTSGSYICIHCIDQITHSCIEVSKRVQRAQKRMEA